MPKTSEQPEKEVEEGVITKCHYRVWVQVPKLRYPPWVVICVCIRLTYQGPFSRNVSWRKGTMLY